MTSKTKDIILAILIMEANSIKATACHIAHQLTLPAKWRLDSEMSEDELGETLKDLNLRYFDLQDAISELNGHPKHIPTHQDDTKDLPAELKGDGVYREPISDNPQVDEPRRTHGGNRKVS